MVYTILFSLSGRFYWTSKRVLLLGLMLHGMTVAAHEKMMSQTPAHQLVTHQAITHLAVSVTADDQGRLWQAAVRQGQVWVSVSTDQGKQFSSPVAVNATPQAIVVSSESRPAIVVSPQGTVFVSWVSQSSHQTGSQVWLAQAPVASLLFSAPVRLGDPAEQVSQRENTLSLAGNGEITVLWLEQGAVSSPGSSSARARIRFAQSNDLGRTMGPVQTLAEGVCECCRLAHARQADGRLGILWRHMFGAGERDHAMAEIASGVATPMVRASFGHWKLDGCPHHGAALAIGEGFGYHLAYFEGGGDKPGLRLARMDAQAWVTSPPKRVGNPQHHAGHPALYSQGDQVWLTWRERSDSQAELWGMSSEDGGKTWSSPTVWWRTTGKLDYPQWVWLQGRPWWVVNSSLDGLVVRPAP